MHLRSTTILLVVSGMLVLLAACFNPTPAPTPTATPQVTTSPTPNATVLPPTPAARPVTLKPQELAIPPDQFPLPGFRVTQDTSRDDGKVWRRRFTPADPGTFGYSWLQIDLRSLSGPTSTPWIKAQDCIFNGSGTAPVGSFELTPPTPGDGVRACRYEFADGGRLFTYATGARNVGIFTQTFSSRPGTTDTEAVKLLALLSERQVAIIDRLAPPGPAVLQTGVAAAFQFSPPPVLPAASAGQPYRFSFCQPAPTSRASPCGPASGTTDPTGGSPPYQFQYGPSEGFPPFGITLEKDGSLNGAAHPTTAGRTYRFSVCAVDTKSDGVCREVSLAVEGSPTPTPVVSTPRPTVTPTVTPTVIPPTPGPTPAPVPDLLEFRGETPPVASVTYTTPEGQAVTVPARRGWVSLVVAVGVTGDQVAQAAASARGAVIEANARLGLYTLSSGEGKEGALIARLRRETWVVEASPAFLVGRTQQGDKPVKVVDFPWDPAETAAGDPCHDSHGDLTALQITRLGRRAEVIDVRSKNDRTKETDKFVGFPTFFHTGNRIDEAMKSGSVVNASLGADNGASTAYKLVGAGYGHAQAVFLAMVFRTAESGPDVPVIVSAGNGDANGQGRDLTRYVEALRKQFPNAARRVRLVEAWWKNPRTGVWERAPWSNYSNVGSIAAPGVDVPIQTTGARGLPPGSVKCNGTSFAAPVVSALVDGMRKAAPGQSAGETWARFEKVTQRNVPTDLESPALARRLAREATGHGLASLQLDPLSVTIQQGKNYIFRPVAKEANGAVIDDIPGSAFTWSSASPTIATVDKAGFVDGKSPGTTVITASIQGIQAKATVTVTAPPTPASTLTGAWTGKAILTTTVTGGTCQYAGDITLLLKHSDTALSGTINYDLVGNPDNSRVRCPATTLKGSAPLSGAVKGGAAVRFSFTANGFNIDASGLSWFGAFIEGDFSGDATGEYRVEPGSAASGAGSSSGGSTAGGGGTGGGGGGSGCQSDYGTLTIGGFYSQLKGVLQGDAGTGNYSNSGRESATLTVPAGNYTMTWYNDAGELFRRDSFAISPCGTKRYS